VPRSNNLVVPQKSRIARDAAIRSQAYAERNYDELQTMAAAKQNASKTNVLFFTIPLLGFLSP
jgi:hypothetical protein